MITSTIKTHKNTLIGYKKINVVLGKNGSGKSTLLRSFINDSELSKHYNITYISPERGGLLQYDIGVVNNMRMNSVWISSERNKNQVSSFKQQTYQNFTSLMNIAADNYQNQTRNLLTSTPYSGDLITQLLSVPTSYEFIEKINSLLDESLIIKAGVSSEIVVNDNNRKLSEISSGEAEVIAIAMESLYCFMASSKQEKSTILLLDEPDVHLHPDLQYRLIKFLLKETENREDIQIFIATHSTPILSALGDYADATVNFLQQKNEGEIKFTSITEALKAILPVFGVHPLTRVYSKMPILIVEGEDDVRIWQQVVKTSRGTVKIHPIECDGCGNMGEFVKTTNEILMAVYEGDARAYALRDGDGKESLQSKQEGRTLILYLQCYGAENLFLTDEVLASCNKNWDELKVEIDEHLVNVKNKTSTQYKELLDFKEKGYNRKNFKIKESRNVLVGLLTTKA